jgi:hypothetical protein
MQMNVLITYPDGEQRCVRVGPAGLRVGRAPDNDLVVPLAGVAQYHVVIRLAHEGHTRLRPTAGRPLVVEVPAGGEAGAAVRLGGYTIRLTELPSRAAA